MRPDQKVLDPAHDALNKMRRAAERGTGCRLTAEEIASLRITKVGALWSQDDPRCKSDTPDAAHST